MQRYYRIDLRDLYRFDSDGRRVLSLRRLSVLLLHLPPDCSTRQALGLPTLTATDYRLMDLWTAITKVPHPGYPKVEDAVDPAHDKRVAAFRKRSAERQRAIDAGEIT